ncbi:MAG: cobalt ECF transporter T component CbiQ, partial [Candidatus Margulisiibacteriota bacterium]
ANRDSLIHRVPAKIKIVLALLSLVFVLVMPISFYPFFLFYFFGLVILIFISRVPPLFVLLNSLSVIPFVFLVSLYIPFFYFFKLGVAYSGLVLFLNVLVKSWLSILTLLLVSTTTRFSRFLKGLEELKLPRLLTLILSFMYRYLFVLVDEVMRIRRSVEARAGKLDDYKTIGNFIGTLFLRSFERGERIYLAMLARGFEGEIKEIE